MFQFSLPESTEGGRTLYFLNVLEDRRRDAIVPKIIRLATNQATEASTDGLMPRLMHVDFEGFKTGPDTRTRLRPTHTNTRRGIWPVKPTGVTTSCWRIEQSESVQKIDSKQKKSGLQHHTYIAQHTPILELYSVNCLTQPEPPKLKPWGQALGTTTAVRLLFLVVTTRPLNLQWHDIMQTPIWPSRLKSRGLWAFEKS